MGHEPKVVKGSNDQSLAITYEPQETRHSRTFQNLSRPLRFSLSLDKIYTVILTK